MGWGDRGWGGSQQHERQRRLASGALHITIQGLREVVPGGIIRNRTKTAYNAGNGFYLGIPAEDGVAVFGIGDTSNYLTWDGTTLTIAGEGSGITNIDGGNIQTGTITADQITANTITANELAVGSVTFEQLVIGGLSDNLIQDAGFESGSATTIHDLTDTGGGTWSVQSTIARSGNYALQYNATGQSSTATAYLNGNPTAANYLNRHVSAVQGREFNITAWGYRAAGDTSNRVRLYTRWYDADGVAITTNYTTFDPATWTDNTWTELQSQKTAPAGTAYVVWSIDILNDGNTGSIYFDDIEARSRIGPEHIQAGAITATEIAANTITANQIATGTITATELNISTLSAITADLGTITAGVIKMGAGTKDVDLTGFQLDSTEIVGQAGGVDQVSISSSTGKLHAGAVTLDQYGLTAATGGNTYFTLNTDGIILKSIVDEAASVVYINDDNTIYNWLISTLAPGVSPDFAELEIIADVEEAATDTQIYIESRNSAFQLAQLNVRAWSTGNTYMKAWLKDSQANTSTGLIISHSTLATPAAGLGSEVKLQTQTSTTHHTDCARIVASWTNITHASRTSRLSLYANDSVAERELLRGEADGTAGKLESLVAHHFDEYLYHAGDTDTHIRFQPDQITLVAGGTTILDLTSGTPVLIFRETDQALPAGKWRLALDNDVFKLQRNTATGGDFSTLTTPIQINSSDQVGIGAAPSEDFDVHGDNFGMDRNNASYGPYMNFYKQGTLVGRIHSYDANGLMSFMTGATPSAILNLDTSGRVFINETANSKMTVGLTINQGANDNEILALKSSDVAHGMTSSAETDTFFVIKKQQAASGGGLLVGYKDTDATNSISLNLRGVLDGTADTAKSASASGLIALDGRIRSGTGTTTVGTNGNLVVVRNKTTTRVIFDAEGDLHLDATLTENAWDDEDDLALLHGLRASMMPAEHELRRRFGHFIEQARPVLEATKCITYNDGPDGDGSIFIAMKKLQMLTIDAVRQLGERNRQLEVKVEQLERKLLTA